MKLYKSQRASRIYSNALHSRALLYPRDNLRLDSDIFVASLCDAIVSALPLFMGRFRLPKTEGPVHHDGPRDANNNRALLNEER